MTNAEKLALAILRGGLSYADAAQQSKLTVAEVKALWERNGKR
jgi:hypothetical protein